MNLGVEEAQDAQNWDEVVCYSVIGRQWGTLENIPGASFLPICDVFELQPNKGIKMKECAKDAKFVKTMKIA